MTHPTGTYNAKGQLVADRRGVPLTVIQDPDTGDRLWVYSTGRIHHRARPRTFGTQVDVDRLNALLRAPPYERAERVAMVIFALSFLAGFVWLLWTLR